jgi:hypothetical protein
MIKLRMLRWARNVARMESRRNACMVLVVEIWRRETTWLVIGVDGRIILCEILGRTNHARSLIWHRLHGKWLLQQFCCFMCIHYTAVTREVRCWDMLKCLDMHVKFDKDWFMRSKVKSVGYSETQTAWWSHKPAFIVSKWGKWAKIGC